MKTTAEARNVKVEYPGNVGNLTQSLLPIVCNAPVSRWNMINYLRTCRACVPIPDPPLPIPPPPPETIVTIVNDIPYNAFATSDGGGYYENIYQITWECVPPSEVKVELFVNASVFDSVTTTGTSYTFDAVSFGMELFDNRMVYVKITPTVGPSVNTRTAEVYLGYM